MPILVRMHILKNSFSIAAALLCLCACELHGQDADELKPAPAKVRSFLNDNCLDCHQGKSAEGGFDIEELSDQLTAANTHDWTRLLDRVRDEEMPPKDYSEIRSAKRRGFLKSTGNWIDKVQTTRANAIGRVGARRLTNLQLERTLHDLLGINIPLASHMPDEPRTKGYTSIAAGQSMSHFQLEQHVNIVDLALDNAFERAFTRKEDQEWKLSAKKISRTRERCREPELIDDNAVTWSGRVAYYGRIPATVVKQDGWYRFTIKAKGLNLPKTGGVWCTVRSGKCISSAPLMGWLGSFEAEDSYREFTFTSWLKKDHMLEIRPGDATAKKGDFRGGQIETGLGAKQDLQGVAIKFIKMQRIEPSFTNDQVRDLLFAKERVVFGKNSTGSIKTESPEATLKDLLYRFAKKAFRRPIKNDDIAPYLKISKSRLEKTGDFVSALRVGYRSILCSPRFIYLFETPGKLDDFSIAARMSYFLWNRMLDEELWVLASKGKLSDPEVVKQQVERMLRDPKGKNFVVDLADQWLDLNQIDFTEPDRRLYPGFDPIVENAMLDETHRFLQEMIDEDLGISNLIDSDFTFLNSRLARYYEFANDGFGRVVGDEFRKINVSKTDHRGGLITHGSIMKVTSNGNNTSPVIRGVWISERLLGEHIPPPPENVPAIEPDIRGAKSIREQLEKHKDSEDCAACHRKIDPPGFALENFDPSGRWRDHYGEKWKKKNKKRVIDTGSEMPDGKKFETLKQFKTLVLKDQKKLAINVAEQLMTCGTGGTIQFSDRDDIEACVAKSKKYNYGLRTLIKEVIASDLFTSK